MIFVFLAGILLGYLVFETYLRLRFCEMQRLMAEKKFYDPVLLEKAVSKFWIPLERLIDESRNSANDCVPL